MRFKKILSAVLAAAISASSISVISSAKAPQKPQIVEETVENTYQASGDSFVSGDFKYTELQDGTLEVKCNNKEITKAVIPSTVNGKKVTSIDNYAFSYCKGLTTVTIPNSVTSIGYKAFHGCTSLTTVTIPNGVTEIGDSAFYGCTSLTSVTISNSVTSIGYEAFDGCTSLTTVTIPNSVTSIGYEAFSGCTSLTSVTIPNSVTDIYGYTFHGCTSLTTVTIPNSVTFIGGGAFYGCTSLTTVTIPNSVTSIGDSAFSGCTSLTSITVNANNKNYCSVSGVLFNKDKSMLIQYPAGKTAKSYTIPNSVTSIGYGAFSGCTSLTSVTIPNSVTDIYNYTFSGCTSLTTVTIPNSVTSIGYKAFYGCTSLTTVTIQNGVTEIGDSAFFGCTSLTTVTIPNSVTSIGYKAFYGCTSLTTITIPNSETSIGYEAFSGCTSLTSITVNANNKNYCSVSGVLFNKDKSTLIQYPAGKTAKSYTIPNTVTSIGRYAFYNCTSLTTVTIPNSVTEIGGSAFVGCTSLISISVNANNKNYCSVNGVLFNKNKTALIQYPAGKTEKSYMIPNSVTSIGGNAFDGCTGLISITVNANNKKYCSVNGVLFNKNKTVLIQYPAGKTEKSYTIPNSVTRIFSDAFSGCTSLTSVKIPNSVTEIGDSAFEGCTSLTTVTVPNSVTEIDDSAFEGCTSLTSVMIPNSVIIIGESAFSGCTSLKDVYYTGTEAQWKAIYKAYFGLNNATVYCNFSSKVASVKSTVTNSSVKLTWNKFVPASCYKVWVKQDGAWKLLKKTANNTTLAYMASGLKGNTSYNFRVAAYNESGTMIAYTDITAKTKGKIVGLKSVTSKSAVKLTWNKNTVSSFYKVWIWKDGKWTLLTQTKDNSVVTYTAKSLNANTSYKFRVTAYNKSGNAIAYSDITAKTTA